MTKLENRIIEAEGRVGANEDTARRHEQAIPYLLHREIHLSVQCEDMQNRLRRNNLRIYRVPEGSEGNHQWRLKSDEEKERVKREREREREK